MFNIDIKETLMRLPILLLSLTLHEFAHGYAAYRLGDTTAKTDGRLSFNPLRHIDPIGFICMLVYQFGWAKPVMVDMSVLENPKKDMAVIASAGPLVNLLLAFVMLLIFYPFSVLVTVNSVTTVIGDMLVTGFFMNISLAVFNLLPIPPLDGSKIFGAFLPDRLYVWMMKFGRYGFLILILLIWTDKLSDVLTPLIIAVYDMMLFVISKVYFFL